jgi:hypothetical protein
MSDSIPPRIDHPWDVPTSHQTSHTEALAMSVAPEDACSGIAGAADPRAPGANAHRPLHRVPLWSSCCSEQAASAPYPEVIESNDIEDVVIDDHDAYWALQYRSDIET